ncbi:DUF6090 family protein [Winogradskyella vincentii]|uniref:Uncharacterized protein n=1 Tax=Winogradskyella vincentii TaxID=2877122 RepID=A0ABS7Y3L8_9FLAO|nr:DUF6090 family protein [Winogradskyella vincentii]MCA0154525.1 hypothetical protein [Winogradskyella vincentii]
MIKFFRKIRQNLLSENKFSKYLIYAFGEIILVVIGILIALSINNQNENKKDKTKEKVYLESLYQELKQDSIYLEKTNNTLASIEKNGRYVISIIENQKKITSDTLKFLNAVRRMIASNQTLPEPIIWKELQSSGNLRLIQNRELIKALFAYYHKANACQQDYKDNAHHFILDARYFDSKLFSIEDQDDYFDNWKKDNIPSHKVLQTLLSDKEFYANAKGIVTGMIISRKVLSGLRKNLEIPLAILRNELNEK